MRTPVCTISLADLSATGIPLQPPDAVVVAHDLTLRAERGDLPGIPSANVVRFSSDGALGIEGPVAAGRSVERAARLLDAMLPGFDAPSHLRPAGALRLVIARALGTLDLPAYTSLDEFARALERFAAPDRAASVRALCESWSEAVSRAEGVVALQADAGATEAGDTELTISDVRRARRATGLTLSDISDRSRIPISLLRELEWGYFVNWPDGHYGRTQLVRYAHAAGLDDEVVIQAVWPVLQDAIRARASGKQVFARPFVERPFVEDSVVMAVASTTVDASTSTSLIRDERTLTLVRQDDPRRRRRLFAVLAIPALLAVGLIPAVWNAERSQEPSAPVSGSVTTQAPAREPVARSMAGGASTIEGTEASIEQRKEVTTGPAPVAQVPTPRTPASNSPAAVPAAERTMPSTEDRADPHPAQLSGQVAFSPAFASTGSAMFYHSGRSGDSSAIMRADTDGTGGVLRVTSIVNDNAQNFHARPSPDGRMIAFDSDREGERAVYLADASGGDVRRVTGQGFAAVPSWSPDGRRLAYVRAEPGRPRVWNLWSVDLASGDTTRLTSHRVGQPWGAAWFADGRRIAYSHEDRLIIRSLDSGSERVFTSPKKGRLLRTPAVSPDGRRVIFQVYKDGAWMLDLSDGSMTRILTDPTAEEFTWSSDGRNVAYHSRKTGDWGVWVMAAR